MGKPIKAVVIVAHPDDETIWAGGTVLMNSDWQWLFVSLCRGSDPDRAPKFTHATSQLGGVGKIGDLDDGSEQLPLDETDIQQTILSLLPSKDFDVVLTHSTSGEYTRHRRHEECGKAVYVLWRNGMIKTNELWMFAYKDNGKGTKDDLPHAIKTAHQLVQLPEDIWRRKRSIITDVYGFAPETYEVKIVLREEAFWCFHSPTDFQKWFKN